jgi:DNA primase
VGDEDAGSVLRRRDPSRFRVPSSSPVSSSATLDRFEDAKLRVKESADLVRVVSEYLPLRDRGQTKVGLCPFHGEKTPSFTVYPRTQHFKCYGCGKAGDVFTFLMEREGLTFREAMERLAEDAAIPLDGVFGRGGGGAKASGGPIAHEVLAAVRDWFVDVLHGPDGAEAREYLASRGLQRGAASFGLGAHPPRPGELLRFAKDRRLPREILEQSGLIGRTGREVHLGRLMFPIADERGRVLGFGGRVLPSMEAAASGDRKPPKYLNSPESPFFAKRRLLYGLGHVKTAAARQVVVVEGYTDVIACHLAGFQGAVATLGTALTAEHARVLERWAQDGVVLLFDGDAAGRRAAERAFRELVHTPLPVRIGLLPEGEDPADLAGLRPGLEPAVAEAGRQQLQSHIEGAQDALTVWFRLLRDREDLSTDVGVQRAARLCVEVLGEVEDPVRREALASGMARQLAVRDQVLLDLLRNRGGRGRRRPAQAERAVEAPIPEAGSGEADSPGFESLGPEGWDDLAPRDAAQQASRPETVDLSEPLASARIDLLACVFADPPLATRLDPSFFEGSLWTGVRERLAHAVETLGHRDTDALSRYAFALADGPNHPLQGLFAEALDRSRRVREPRSMFDHGCRGMTLYFGKQKLRRIRQAIEAARAEGDDDRVRALSIELVETIRSQRPAGASTGVPSADPPDATEAG